MIGFTISHYKITQEISTGGMATVYLGQDTKTNTRVAIKILHERLLTKEKITERFTQEGLFKLNHPNIVKVLEWGSQDSIPFIVMEYIDGWDLEELIKSKKKLPVYEALSIFTQILSALSYVHSQGIIHRDIKPKNILIDSSGTAKLTDFGIAKSLYSHIKTSTGGYLGAPAYSSPEQMDGKELDARADIYSLGITFYEMLAGVTPFSTTSIEEIIKSKFIGKPSPITNYRSDIPGYIISIINKSIARDKNNRFNSVKEIFSMIEKNRTDTIIREKTFNTQAASSFSYKKLKTAFITITVILVLIIFAMSAIIVNYQMYVKQLAETLRVIDENIKPIESGSESYERPKIRELKASTKTVSPGEVIEVSVDCDITEGMIIEWVAARGVFSDPASYITSWTAPDKLGTYSIVVTVTDINGQQDKALVEIVVTNNKISEVTSFYTDDYTF